MTNQSPFPESHRDGPANSCTRAGSSSLLIGRAYETEWRAALSEAFARGDVASTASLMELLPGAQVQADIAQEALTRFFWLPRNTFHLRDLAGLVPGGILEDWVESTLELAASWAQSEDGLRWAECNRCRGGPHEVAYDRLAPLFISSECVTALRRLTGTIGSGELATAVQDKLQELVDQTSGATLWDSWKDGLVTQQRPQEQASFHPFPPQAQVLWWTLGSDRYETGQIVHCDRATRNVFIPVALANALDGGNANQFLDELAQHDLLYAHRGVIITTLARELEFRVSFFLSSGTDTPEVTRSLDHVVETIETFRHKLELTLGETAALFNPAQRTYLNRGAFDSQGPSPLADKLGIPQVLDASILERTREICDLSGPISEDTQAFLRAPSVQSDAVARLSARLLLADPSNPKTIKRLMQLAEYCAASPPQSMEALSLALEQSINKLTEQWGPSCCHVDSAGARGVIALLTLGKERCHYIPPSYLVTQLARLSYMLEPDQREAVQALNLRPSDDGKRLAFLDSWYFYGRHDRSQVVKTIEAVLEQGRIDLSEKALQRASRNLGQAFDRYSFRREVLDTYRETIQEDAPANALRFINSIEAVTGIAFDPSPAESALLYASLLANEWVIAAVRSGPASPEFRDVRRLMGVIQERSGLLPPAQLLYPAIKHYLGNEDCCEADYAHLAELIGELPPFESALKRIEAELFEKEGTDSIGSSCTAESTAEIRSALEEDRVFYCCHVMPGGLDPNSTAAPPRFVEVPPGDTAQARIQHLIEKGFFKDAGTAIVESRGYRIPILNLVSEDDLSNCNQVPMVGLCQHLRMSVLRFRLLANSALRK